MDTSRLPPALVVGAHYDSFLQRALRRFFERATLEAEAVPSPSSDGRLAIEPTSDPGALVVRWFGNRYVLRVPRQRPFTENEVRFARAIGTVLSARFHAILRPQAIIERGGLFRGAIEDCYVGAFFDPEPYGTRDTVPAPPDRVAEAIEILRVAALSTYENHPISTGVLLLGGDTDPVSTDDDPGTGPRYTGALTAIKSFFRLADGVRTAFLVGRDSRLLDIVDVDRWATQAAGGQTLAVPCAEAYTAHARATLTGGHVAVVLSPQREIKVFARGEQVFAFRHADWHLLDLAAKYQMWEAAVGSSSLARRLFQTALDLSDSRQGALFVVLRRPLETLRDIVTEDDRLDMEPVAMADDDETPSRRHLLHVLAGRSVTDLDASVLAALATLDGAMVCDPHGHLLAAGAILRHPPGVAGVGGRAAEGARTTAAMAASQFGPVLKVSEDGLITCFDGGRAWDI
ncbi:MAG: hypothetical protein R2712_18675 [Vicinamibacterales bacterium]